MKIQTKCTLVIVGLFIIEIMPVPFSALYSLYAIRKRPDWLPRVTEKLYADKSFTHPAATELITQNLAPERALALRKKCTINLVILFAIDLLVPVIIPTALFVVRKRPFWFKSLVLNLYADKLPEREAIVNADADVAAEHPEFLEKMQQKLAELDDNNRQFARSLNLKINS